MDDDWERVRHIFEEAEEFVKNHRFELTDDYLALIDRVEAMPQNQSGADKSHVWHGLEIYKQFFRGVRPVRRRA